MDSFGCSRVGASYGRRFRAPGLSCISLIFLCLFPLPGNPQETELGALPLPPRGEALSRQPAVVRFSLLDSSNFTQSFQQAQKNSSREKPDTPGEKTRAGLRQGTSNDRILWTMPNFLTLEDAENIPPLTPKEKFAVTARGVFDPFEFVLVGFVAGINQASGSDPSYGGGMQGYAKRYGTAYGDNAIENFMSSAVFPSILHQDPRYYQMGQGGFWKRTKHAAGRVLITRSDSGEKQLNYSELGGALTAAAISTYTYHPQSDRGFSEVVNVWGSQMGWDVVTYMIKEFWPDLRKRRHQKNDLSVEGHASNTGESER